MAWLGSVLVLPLAFLLGLGMDALPDTTSLSRTALIGVAGAGSSLLLLAHVTLSFRVVERRRTSLGKGLSALAATAFGMTAAAWLGVKLLIFPDEVCIGPLTTFAGDATRELDRRETPDAAFTLTFNRKGYAGDAPMPMVEVDKRLKKAPRVKKCRAEGTVFEHWITKEPKTGSLDLERRVIRLRYADGSEEEVPFSGS